MGKLSEDRIQHCLDQLAHLYAEKFDSADRRVEKIISPAARFSLETIAQSNAPYHNVDHTIHVTLAGQAILAGLHLSEKAVAPGEWGQFTIALLFHDIG